MRPVAWGPDIWTINGPEINYALGGASIPCPTRMTVVRLRDSGLWVHSPVCLTPEVTAQMAEIGPVAFVLAPNAFHYSSFSDWAQAFPDAVLYTAPGLDAKIAPRSFEVLSEHLMASWRAEIDLHVFELGHFTEAVFFHRVSRTLIVTDLMQNFEAGRVRNPLVRFLLFAGGATGPNGRASIEIRLAARHHRAALRRGVDQMIAWQPASVILSHGKCYRTDAAAEIERAFRWIG
ncbi:DUF4336 domain-containing protein [Novosphingobium sp.]|uniref:DUF4336 domain-containing protein n=1 Tax=Novosphingobium sp. TaxID=1874826 RepID=UPI0026082846|nr:DUF4336 domain-containing protein [Novosphingobium sp.]